MNHDLLKKYAKQIIKAGVNIQEGQPLIINAQVTMYDFVRLVVEEAYQAGASEVVVRWADQPITAKKIKYADEKVLGHFREWIADMLDDYMEDNMAVLSLVGSDPDAFAGLDPKKIQLSQVTMSKGLENYYKRMMADEFQWCVAAVATKEWADVVFPEEENNVEKLWDAILVATRADQDNPVEAVMENGKMLVKKSQVLNNMNLEYVHITSEKGTDLTVGLIKNHIWSGGPSKSQKDVVFSPNIPTEEVFTAPDAHSAEGIVYSTKPLDYSGNLIEDFWLKFEDGEVVDYDAKKNKDALESLLTIDDGAKRLGEIAFVPYDSPINKTGILFMETLFDENAACHLAVGKAYPTCVKNVESLSEDERDAIGLNESLTHVDFMIGDETTKIVGVDFDGGEHLIFEDGNWKI